MIEGHAVSKFIFKNQKAKYQKGPIHYGLGYSTSGNLETTLFPGAVYDSFKMTIYAQIYGTSEVYTIFDLTDAVIVIPDIMSDLDTVEKRLISKDPTFSANILLSQGSYLESVQEIQRISGLLNEQSLSDELGLKTFNNNTDLKFPPVYGPLASYEGVVPVKITRILTRDLSDYLNDTFF